MDLPKIIHINYEGSFVQTSSTVAVVFLVLGEIAAAVVLFTNVSWVTGAAMAVGVLLIYVVLMALSKLLEHVYYLRKIAEAKALDEGYELKKKKFD